MTDIRRLCKTGLLLIAGVALMSCTSLPTDAPHPASAPRLQALFDRAWEADMRRSPEWATYLGDNRYGDRLEDASPAGEAGDYAAKRQLLADAQAVDRPTLSAKDRTSLDIFIYGLQQDLAYEPLVGLRRRSLGAIGGFHTQFAELLNVSPVDTAAQVEQMLARLAAYPRRVDEELVRLREGMALGWVPPRAVLDRVVAALDGQIRPGEEGPYFQPFKKLGKDIPQAEQDALRDRALRAIREQVIPAQRRLRDFVAGPYLAAAPADGAMSRYPGGAAAYVVAVRSQTTTDLSPAEVHAIGLGQVTRLRIEIDGAMRDMKWQGDFASFVHHLNTAPEFFYPGREELLAGYRDIAKRVDAELPRLFTELPRTPYGVRAMPAYRGPDAAEYYDPPPLDGSRPGWFNANTEGFRTRPKWGMETLAAHEAVPGHHLQIARASELGDLPKFRRASGFGAYIEGWALYAETLGFDLGLYKDPASRFGHLQSQMFRATRLVVDTGIHSQGWSRQRAVDYMVDATGMDRGFIGSEVDRYTSYPGQALSYMIGELKIIELRDRARSRLGTRFDIRRFHMAVLDQGTVPLSVLERQIDEWILVEAARG